VIVYVVGDGFGVVEVIDYLCLYVDELYVYCEGGFDVGEVDCLEVMGYDVVCWCCCNFFFGGMNVVEVLFGGELVVVGDVCCGGDGVVV